MLKDKMGQDISVGMWIIRGRRYGASSASVEFGKVTKMNEQYIWIDDRQCRHPHLCIVVPDIVANYWSILK
tara:strand:- start:57708 stop:57920 length:213 start_codon:yes stop_codon:yes gene_type:complete